MFFLSLSLSSIAHALPTDDDGDGWYTESSPGDCDDDDPLVNPEEAEDGVDLTDEDCDGSVTIRRDFVSGFETLGDFNSSGSVTHLLGGRVQLMPTSSTPAQLTLKRYVDWEGGVLHVELSAMSLTSGVTCSVSAHNGASTVTLGSFTSAGVHRFSSTAFKLGGKVDQVRIKCSGSGGSATLDWVTLQNGPYTWAPMMDTSFAFDGMGLPSGGRQSVVRLSEEYSAYAPPGTPWGGIILAGSDVGGLAWAGPHDPEVEGTVWTTANGGWDDWNDGSEMSVADVVAFWRGDESGGTTNVRDPQEFDVYALTGGDGWNQGGFWYSADITGGGAFQSWDEVSTTLKAFKHRDDCGGREKRLSSGRLLLPYPSNDDWLVVGSGGTAGAGSTRGVYFHQRGGTTATELYTGLPDSDTGYAALPSALAAGRPEGPLGGGEMVLVGYRTLADGSSERNALYACPASATTPTAAACYPVADGTTWLTDVRDIEPDPVIDGRFYIADSGRSWDEHGGSSGTGACEEGEPTVYVLDVTLSGGGGSSPWTFTLWDTDDAAGEPNWLDPTSTGETYYQANERACNAASGATLGDLVSPTSIPGGESWDIPTITVDSGGDYLLAFYPKSNGERRWGCASIFRAPLAGVETDDLLAWEPLQDYQWEEMSWWDTDPLYAGAHAGERRSVVDARGSFLEDEPMLEHFAGTFTHDAVFVPAVGVPAGPALESLLVGGAFHWWAFEDPDGTGPGVGWDSPSDTHDLDLIPWALAWAGDEGEPVFQDMTALAAGVCPGCSDGQAADLLLAGGEGDYKYSTLYGEIGGFQPPASRPCEFHKLSSSPNDVSVWADPESSAPAQAWMTFVPQGTANNADHPVVDYKRARALFYSDETMGSGVIGEEWCWDGYEDDAGIGMGFVPAGYLGNGTPSDQLVCHDSGWNTGSPDGGWEACTPSAPSTLQDQQIGMIQAIEAVGQDTALIAAVAACTDLSSSACESFGEDPESAGVWVVTRSTSALTYTAVPFPTGGIGACSKEDFFEYRWDSSVGARVNRRLSLSLHPDSLGAEPGDEVRAFLSSTHPDCGVAELTFTLGSESTTEAWFLLNLGYDGADTGTLPDCLLCASTTTDGDCLDTNEVWGINGTHASRDGDWLFVYGGQATASPTVGTAVCAVNLTTGGSGTYTSYQQAAPASELQMSVWTIASHTHVGDLWYVGGYGSETGDLAKPPGVFALQRRRRWDASSSAFVWSWGFVRVSDDDLQHRAVVDLDLGPGEGSRTSPITTLYVTTAGGSWWDGRASW